MAERKVTTTVPGVRRRVYVLGILSALTALVQIVGHLVMLSLVVNPLHFDGQVAMLDVGMLVLTSAYLALTGRLLFLFHEKRYEETRGPEWLWWFCTLGITIFNCIQLVWFCLIPDPVPAAVCGAAVLLYLAFFKFAKDDLKFLREAAATLAALAAKTAPVTVASTSDDLPRTDV